MHITVIVLLIGLVLLRDVRESVRQQVNTEVLTIGTYRRMIYAIMTFINHYMYGICSEMSTVWHKLLHGDSIHAMHPALSNGKSVIYTMQLRANYAIIIVQLQKSVHVQE